MGSLAGDPGSPSSMDGLFRVKQGLENQVGETVPHLFHRWPPLGWIVFWDPGQGSCVPFSMAGLHRFRKALGSRPGKLWLLLHGWLPLGWSCPGVLGHGSSPPSFMACLCARACQSGDPADTLLLLASPGLPALGLCVSSSMADLPMSDQLLQNQAG